MVSESDILDAVTSGQPFYGEYRRFSKFWLIESLGGPGPLVVRTRFGPIGERGQRGERYTDFRDALKEVLKKERAGYRIHHREVGDAARKWINDATAVLIPFSQWAGTLPPPFNTITFLDSDGFATDHTGALICQLPVDEATAIRQTHDMTR